ncbi:afadin-like [Lampris incognitus]|uniref:afadin-like n=1 Tax=Lampris incognitus TaxID=2546036 RepID=UPI0024B4CCB9|nr:afadin-like [Lampris incognitus]
MPSEEARERLALVIQQWNNKRLDLFEISQPDENLEFHGVVRFYLEDHIVGNVATKCLRVSSSCSTREVIETLSEKFRPDMKMLTTCYSLYEIHSREERRLELDDKPLVVQLNWSADNREGRFVLKKDEESLEESCHEKKEKGSMMQNFKRTLSRKEKKKEKNKTKATGQTAEDGNQSTDKPPNNNTAHVCSRPMKKSDHGRAENKEQERRQSDPGVLHMRSLQPISLNQPGLPVEIKFCENSEDSFLSAVINYTNSSTVHFKLSPAYVLYAAGRFAFQRDQGQSPGISGRTHRVTSMSNKMVAMTQKVVEKQQTSAGGLAFWMANSSELLNFIKNDKDLGPLTQQAQVDLSHLVHKSYRCLTQCLQNELTKHLPTFLIDPEKHGPLPTGIEMVLNTLMNAMSLLRRCRVNPALTIQLFSQLFHFLSAWLFNQLMGSEAGALGLRSHYWGAALRQRLSGIEAWAERQGLELAADCHLGHILQATALLTMSKYSIHDTKDVQSTCFRLNSQQLNTLLTGYVRAADEPTIPAGLIDSVLATAETTADNLVRSDGRDVQAEESLELRLPFLLPEGGYSCDAVKGIPPGFCEFLEPICWLCTLKTWPNLRANWTAFFGEGACREPDLVTITLKKPLNSGMGISIVAAKGAGQDELGIYVKSVVKGGPAAIDGRLNAGDQLLSVDGQSLVGLNQERAAGIIMRTGPVVTLQVAMLGASYYGLEALLSEPNSVMDPGINRGTNQSLSSQQHPPTRSYWRKLNGERGDGPRRTKPNDEALLIHQDVGHITAEQWDDNHRADRRQLMQRNRQLYRSNPNMTDSVGDDQGQPVDLVFRGSRTSAVSTINLCTDRQALSQENLCVDKQHHVWEQRDQSVKQAMSRYSSFPMRPSASSHDVLSDSSSPTVHWQAGCKSGAGLWRNPLSQTKTPTPSTQPIRIDIPIARPGLTQLNPPLATFQPNSSLLAVKLSQNLKGNGQTPEGRQKQSSPLHTGRTYTCPASTTKTGQLPQTSVLPQQQRPIIRREAAKPQVSITPAKQVSFQKLPTQGQPAAGATQPKDSRYFTMSKDLSDASGLLMDPWRRDAREKLEKQQRLQEVELLEQEVQELQAKVSRTAEENDRLRKLRLEWQFQKRLQEIQQKGGDDEDDDDDDDMDMMITIQQLDQRAQVNAVSDIDICPVNMQ